VFELVVERRLKPLQFVALVVVAAVWRDSQ
jgi:hypothetical protein